MKPGKVFFPTPEGFREGTVKELLESHHVSLDTRDRFKRVVRRIQVAEDRIDEALVKHISTKEQEKALQNALEGNGTVREMAEAFDGAHYDAKRRIALQESMKFAAGGTGGLVFLKEAATPTEMVGDHPYIYAALMNKMLLRRTREEGIYQDPLIALFAQELFNDFKDRRWIYVGPFSDATTVGEGETFKELTGSEREVTGNMLKYGAMKSTTWEMKINDDLGALEYYPPMLLDAVNRTFAGLRATKMDAIANAGTTKPINAANLKAGLQLFTAQAELHAKTKVDAVYMVVPIEYDDVDIWTARELLNSAEKRMVGATDATYYTRNILNAELILIGSRYLTKGYWFIATDPGEIATLSENRLRALPTPVLEMRVENTVGNLGSFESMTYAMRVVGVIGHDTLTTYASPASATPQTTGILKFQVA